MRGILLAALVLLGSPAALAGGTVIVPERAQVAGDTILLGEIAEFHQVEPQLEAELRAVVLGRSAPPAQERQFGGAGLRALIRDVAGDVLTVRVPETLRVARSARERDPGYVRARLEEAMHYTMRWPPERTQLSNWRVPETLSLPLGATSMRVVFDAQEDFLGRVPIEIEFFDADQPELVPMRRSASVDVTVKLPVAVSRAQIRRGQIVMPGEVALEMRELNRLPADVVLDVDDVVGRKLTTNVRPDTPILRSYLDAPDIVRRGDLLTVDAGSPGLDVRITARAVESGRLGQVIRVENVSSRKKFPVRITGSGTAELTLPGVGRAP